MRPPTPTGAMLSPSVLSRVDLLILDDWGASLRLPASSVAISSKSSMIAACPDRPYHQPGADRELARGHRRRDYRRRRPQLVHNRPERWSRHDVARANSPSAGRNIVTTLRQTLPLLEWSLLRPMERSAPCLDGSISLSYHPCPNASVARPPAYKYSPNVSIRRQHGFVCRLRNCRQGWSARRS